MCKNVYMSRHLFQSIHHISKITIKPLAPSLFRLLLFGKYALDCVVQFNLIVTVSLLLRVFYYEFAKFCCQVKWQIVMSGASSCWGRLGVLYA